MHKKVAGQAPIDWNLVSTFVRVVDSGTFTAAAAALHLPKSAVSRRVARLEELLGVKLLQRTTRRLRLTDAGHTYYERVGPALAGLEEATAEVTELSLEPRGRIRVTAPPNLGAWLAEVVGRFLQRHPQIFVEAGFTSRHVDLIAEGYDLAVRAGRLDDSTLVVRKVGASHLGVFASPDYLRRRGHPRTLADLAHHEAVLYRASADRAVWKLVGPDGEEGVEVRGRTSGDDLQYVGAAVKLGLGIGLLPTHVAGLDRKRARGLVRLLPEYASAPGGLYVVVPDRRLPTRVALFREFLVDELAAFVGRSARTPGRSGR